MRFTSTPPINSARCSGTSWIRNSLAKTKMWVAMAPARECHFRDSNALP
jgi:hypothetical protein